MRNLASQYNFAMVLVQAIMCCSFNVIQGAGVGTSTTDASNFTSPPTHIQDSRAVFKHKRNLPTIGHSMRVIKTNGSIGIAIH
jgi:hypothetical protein